MRRARITNSLLTINAILLALVLWILVADHSSLATPATATAPQRGGIPNAGAQRLEMIRELQKMNKSITAISDDLTKSEIKVRVTSMPAGKSGDGE